MYHKMPKKWVLLITVVILIFSGCLSAPTVKISVDDNLLQRETANIIVSSNITITKFNGIDVKNEWYPRNARKNLNLTIPAGETQFTYNMYWQVASGQVNSWLEGKDIKFSYNFEAGREYTVGYYSKSVGKFLMPKHELYLAVWDCLYPDAFPDKSHEGRILKQWLVSIY